MEQLYRRCYININYFKGRVCRRNWQSAGFKPRIKLNDFFSKIISSSAAMVNLVVSTSSYS